MKVIRSILLCCVLGVTQAQSFNDIFPVSEISFLTLIEEQLRHPSTALQIEIFETYALQFASQYTDKTKTLKLPRALQAHNAVYTPTITLPRNIYAASGRLLWHQGAVLNVLEQIPTYQPDWIFIDGHDDAQLQWAKNQLKQGDHVRVILTNDAMYDATSKLQHEVFFDQGGYISQKLGIKHLPARVTRQGNILLIQEIKINPVA